MGNIFKKSDENIEEKQEEEEFKDISNKIFNTQINKYTYPPYIYSIKNIRSKMIKNSHKITKYI